ncbi:MAG: excinuclease ABC subunit UvrC [Candidatus Nomurabacteria bacterium]|nr:excinuclease ABC subunit UvrC [Candidatus Nomurabacteria bacterium]
MNAKLSAKLKTLPRAPGVYFHYDKTGEVIYVGKAAVLKNRVRQYFQKNHDDAKTRALVNEIAMTDWIETDSEIDALFLESEMIKRYRPRYNILLRDDRSQMFVRINWRDPVPFVSFTRRPLDDGAEYFGPFYNGWALKKALRLLRRAFPYYVDNRPNENQLDFQLGLTPGVKLVSGGGTVASSAPKNFFLAEKTFLGAAPRSATSAESNCKIYNNRLKLYIKNLHQLASYIKGNRKTVQREIEAEMKAASAARDYETAARLRNQLRDLGELQKQIVFGREEFMDISKDQALKELQNLLGLKKPPRRIEGYDISHISGSDTTASMVVFTGGVADKTNYRKFKLRLKGNDDYAHLAETIARRLKHLKDWGRPDLVLIDGGVGQLNAVKDLLEAEKIPFVGRAKAGQHGGNSKTVLLIPKNQMDQAPSKPPQPGKTQASVPERTAVATWMAPSSNATDNFYRAIPLDNQSHLAKLIARIDDEAHRFAISYHTLLRKKRQTKNALEEIPGIGAKTRAKLIKKFGSVGGVKKAGLEQIAAVVGTALAEKIQENL